MVSVNCFGNPLNIGAYNPVVDILTLTMHFLG